MPPLKTGMQNQYTHKHRSRPVLNSYFPQSNSCFFLHVSFLESDFFLLLSAFIECLFVCNECYLLNAFDYFWSWLYCSSSLLVNRFHLLFFYFLNSFFFHFNSLFTLVLLFCLHYNLHTEPYDKKLIYRR